MEGAENGEHLSVSTAHEFEPLGSSDSPQERDAPQGTWGHQLVDGRDGGRNGTRE